jgi:hypothetical protein
MSFIATQLAGFGVSDGVTEAVYTTSSFSGTDLTTYTFTSQGFGTVTRPRHIVVGVHWHRAGAHRTVSSITADSVSGTLLHSVQRTGGGAEMDMAFYIFPGTAIAATGSVAITFNGDCNRCGIIVWAVYNLGSAAAQATASGLSTSPHTLDLNVLGGGVVLGLCQSYGTPAIVWTGLTEDVQMNDAGEGNGNELSGASVANAAAATPRSVSVTYSAGEGLGAAVALR